MSDGFDNAVDMMGTGIGLGILTLGAMVPLVIMKKDLDQNGNHVSGKKNFKVNIPKMNMNFKIPPVTVKKIKIK